MGAVIKRKAKVDNIVKLKKYTEKVQLKGNANNRGNTKTS